MSRALSTRQHPAGTTGKKLITFSVPGRRALQQLANTVSSKRLRLAVLAFLAFTADELRSERCAAAAVTVTLYPLPAGPGGPSMITAGPDGNLWFTLEDNNNIGKITMAGVITLYPIPTTQGAFGITAGPDGNLWFTDAAGNKIGKITTGGVVTQYPVPTGGSGLGGIVAGPDGALWFTEGSPGNKIGRVTTGGSITEYPTPTFGAPTDITVGPDGSLWFTKESGSADKIGRVTTSGVFAEYDLPTASADPYGIAAGLDGNLWFTELSANKIGRVTTGGVFAEYSLPTPGALPFFGIVGGPDGNLWFTEYANGKLGSISPAGTVTEYPTAGSGLRDIAQGADGNLWFTAYNSREIGKLDLRGDTPSGSNVAVPLNTTILNTKTGLEETIDVDVTFSSVISPGITILTATSTPTDIPPPDFTSDIGVCSRSKKLGCETDGDCPSGQTCSGYHGYAFDLSISATVSGPITVCTHYADNERRVGGNGYVDGTGKPGLPEPSLRLLHEENGVFVDVTLPGYPDTVHNVVCGQVNSLTAAAAANAGRTIGTVQGAFGLYVKTDMPGSGRRLDLDCMSEWSLGNPKAGNPTLPKKKRGTWFFPDAQLTCKAGSAKCQAPTPGFCTFRLRVCLNMNDSRLPCQPTDVKEFQLLEPKLADPPTDNDSINALRILEKLGGLSASNTFATQVSLNSAVTSSVCTDNIEVTVPANAIPKSIKLTATDTNSRADTNTVKLLCNP